MAYRVAVRCLVERSPAAAVGLLCSSTRCRVVWLAAALGFLARKVL